MWSNARLSTQNNEQLNRSCLKFVFKLDCSALHVVSLHNFHKFRNLQISITILKPPGHRIYVSDYRRS